MDATMAVSKERVLELAIQLIKESPDLMVNAGNFVKTEPERTPKIIRRGSALADEIQKYLNQD